MVGLWPPSDADAGNTMSCVLACGGASNNSVPPLSPWSALFAKTFHIPKLDDYAHILRFSHGTKEAITALQHITSAVQGHDNNVIRQGR